MKKLSIGPDTIITLHFSLSLEDGSIVDSNFDTEPAVCTFGDGKLLSGFEAALVGLIAGDKSVFSIKPENGFGQNNPNNIQEFPRKNFKEIKDLQLGLMISFADANGGELPGVIADIGETIVKVDFNHPLASHTIKFEVEIISVEPVEKSDRYKVS